MDNEQKRKTDYQKVTTQEQRPRAQRHSLFKESNDSRKSKVKNMYVNNVNNNNSQCKIINRIVNKNVYVNRFVNINMYVNNVNFNIKCII